MLVLTRSSTCGSRAGSNEQFPRICWEGPLESAVLEVDIIDVPIKLTEELLVTVAIIVALVFIWTCDKLAHAV